MFAYWYANTIAEHQIFLQSVFFVIKITWEKHILRIGTWLIGTKLIETLQSTLRLLRAKRELSVSKITQANIFLALSR